MDDKNVYIKLGKGNHVPDPNKRNIAPMTLELCADARRESCNYYIKVVINNDDMSFTQEFCGWKFRKNRKDR